MSIGFLIPMYPDELFSGYLMRLFKASPYIYPKSFAEAIFVNKKERMNYLYINNLKSNMQREIDKQFGLQNIIQNHTLIGFNNLFGKYVGRNKTSGYLRYCPMCERYFQVLPQIEGLMHCPIHGARFINSEVSLDRSTNYLIKPFHLVKVDNIEIADSSSITVKLGKYINDILNVSKNVSKVASIASFLREHIPNKYRVNRRGTQIRLEALKNDLDNYYEMLETYSLSKRQLARILNGESVNPFQICLIGFFLNISPEKMVNRKMKRHNTLHTKVTKLKGDGLSERAIANKLKVSKTLVHKTLKKLEENI